MSSPVSSSQGIKLTPYPPSQPGAASSQHKMPPQGNPTLLQGSTARPSSSSGASRGQTTASVTAGSHVVPIPAAVVGAPPPAPLQPLSAVNRLAKVAYDYTLALPIQYAQSTNQVLWRGHTGDALRTAEGALEACRFLLRASLPTTGATLLSKISLDAIITNNHTCSFVDLLKKGSGSRSDLIAGNVLLMTPLIDQVFFQWREPNFAQDLTRGNPPVPLTQAHKARVNEAARSFFSQIETLSSIASSAIGANYILGLKSGNGPVAFTTVGTGLNLLIAMAVHLDMNQELLARNTAEALTVGNIQPEQDFREIRTATRIAGGVAGVLGLGGAVGAAVIALFNPPEGEDRTKWMVESYLPALACLYQLASCLLEFTKQVRRSPELYIRAQAPDLHA
jgi:hypothetical protein